MGKTGFYFTGEKTMAAAGSDFGRTSRVRVANEAARLARTQTVEFMEGDVRVDKDTGFIDERDAQFIKGRVKSTVRNGLGENVSDVSVEVDLQANILSTENLPIEVSVTPRAIMSTITTTLGFANPAL